MGGGGSKTVTEYRYVDKSPEVERIELERERRRLDEERRQREIAERERIAREQRKAEQREKQRLAQQRKERELRELEEQQRENERKEKERKRIEELQNKAAKQRQELYDYKFGEKINIASFKSLNIADVTHLRIGVFGPTGSGKSCFINTCERAVKLTDKGSAPEQTAGAEGTIVLEDYLGGDLFFTLVDTRGFFNYTRDEKNEFLDILLGRIKPGDRIRRNPEYPGLDICTDEVPFNERLHSIILVVKANDPRLQEGALKDYLNPVRLLLRPIGISPITVVTHHDKLNSDQDREDALSAASAATGSSLSHTFFVANYCSERPHRNVETELQVFEILHFALMSAERHVKIAKQEMRIRIEDSLREAKASSSDEGPQVPLLVYEKRDKVNPGAAEAGRNRAKAENDQNLADLRNELKISEQNALRQAMLADQIDDEFYLGEQKLTEQKFPLKYRWEEEERTRKLQKAEQSSLKLKRQLLEYTFGSRLGKDVFKKLDVSDMDTVRVALIGPTGSGKSCFLGTIEKTLFGDRKQRNFALGAGAEGTIILEEYLAWHDHIKLVDTRGFFDVNEATIQECLNIMTGRIRMGEKIYRDYDDNTASVPHDRTAVKFGDQAHGVIFVVKANDPQLTNEFYLERMKIIRDHFHFSGHSPVTVITFEDKVKSSQERDDAFAKASAATGSPRDRTFFISNYTDYTDDKKEYSMKTENRAMEILDTVLYSAERFVKIHKLREFHHGAQGASGSGEEFEEEHLVVSDLEENYSTQNIWQYQRHLSDHERSNHENLITIQRLHEEIATMRDENAQERNTSQNLRQELRQKQRHLSDLERSNHENLITIQQLHEEIATMRDENAQERNTSQNLRQELEQNQLRLENELDDLRQQNGRLEDRLQLVENENRQLQQDLQEVVRSRDTTPDWAIESNEIYLLQRELGRGGYGVVQEGEFRGSRVAVKQLHSLILSNHNRRLFEREITVASRCRHANLLQFIGATVDRINPLIVMELMEKSLRKLLEERANRTTTLSKNEYLTIATDTAKALNYLHLFKPSGIIHRDISSANVLLWKGNTYWRAKVSDYGTANIMRQSMTVNPGAVIYSAPEAGTKTQTPKMDVYSFGVLLCEMCLCELPDPPQRRSQIASVTDNGIRNLIRNCTKENPEERPSMQQVLVQLTTNL